MLFLSLPGSFQPTPEPSTLPRTLVRLLWLRIVLLLPEMMLPLLLFLAMRRFSTGLLFFFSHLLHLRGSKIIKYSSYHTFSRWAKSMSCLEFLSKYCNRRWCWQGDHFSLSYLWTRQLGLVGRGSRDRIVSHSVSASHLGSLPGFCSFLE